jgi:hypothetical protein
VLPEHYRVQQGPAFGCPHQEYACVTSEWLLRDRTSSSGTFPANDWVGEGFRTPASNERHAVMGRRPEASQERTCGWSASGIVEDAMEIWPPRRACMGKGESCTGG